MYQKKLYLKSNVLFSNVKVIIAKHKEIDHTKVLLTSVQQKKIKTKFIKFY